MTRSLQVRQVEYGHEGCAMPSARAATPSGLSRFASSCKHHIAIAHEDFAVMAVVFALSWFAAALVSAAGQL